MTSPLVGRACRPRRQPGCRRDEGGIESRRAHPRHRRGHGRGGDRIHPTAPVISLALRNLFVRDKLVQKHLGVVKAQERRNHVRAPHYRQYRPENPPRQAQSRGPPKPTRPPRVPVVGGQQAQRRHSRRALHRRSLRNHPAKRMSTNVNGTGPAGGGGDRPGIAGELVRRVATVPSKGVCPGSLGEARPTCPERGDVDGRTQT